VDKAFHRRLLKAPPPTLTIDVEKLTVTLPDGAHCAFPLEKFARYCLLEGKDELGFLLEHKEDIAAHESHWSTDYSMRAFC
jgi:3-isopropylmalate/(R)-2-methylmalate dehydratase small subunit